MEQYLLPQVVQEFIAASNKPDPEAYVDCFSEDAKVLDEGKEWVGKAAIKKWSDAHHFSANVRIDPQMDKQHGAETMVVFKVDGDFDKTGLPDPLYLEFHFQIRNHMINRLAIRLHERTEQQNKR